MSQTPRIFSSNVGIYYYGEVLRTALIRRKNITEVPMTHGNPDDLYYRFQIREWIQLNKPILPKESAFVYEFTNMFLLENVEYVPELLLRSEEEYRLYTELKRRTGIALNDNEFALGFELGDIKISFEDGKIYVYRNGKDVGSCDVLEFSRKPSATFRILQRYLCVSDYYTKSY